MKQLITILLLLHSISLFSQSTKKEIIEETQKEIESSNSDTAKVKLYITLAITYRTFDIDKSDSVSQIAFDLALKSNDPYYVSKAIDNIGHNDVYRGNFNEAIVKFKKALEILNADTVNYKNNNYLVNAQLARTYNNLGMAYDYKSMYSKSIRYYLTAREIFHQIGKIDGEGVTENNLGISYLFAGDFDQSEKHFQRAFDLYMNEIKDTGTAYQAKMNLGIIAYYKGDTVNALKNYREAAVVMKKIGNLRSYGHCITNMAEVFQERGQFDSAFYYLEEGIQVDLDLDDKEGLETDYRIMGSLYLDMKEYAKARKYFLQALDICLHIERKFDIKESYQSLYTLESEVGNYKQALEYHVLMNAYEDSVEQESNSKIIGKMEAEHEFNKQLAVQEVENQQKLQIEAEKSRKQKLIIYFTLGIIGVIMFFVYMLIKSLRQTRKQKELVEEARQEIEQKNEEMVASITYAKRIQTAILPPKNLVEKLLPNSFVLYKPKDIVAGDFYWLEEKGGNILFAAADCTGHGVPGAMVSVICNNGLNRSVREYNLTDPGEILNKTREIVVSEFEKSEDEVKDGMDIALCALEKNPSSTSGSYSIKYAGANNPLWVIRKNANDIEEITADKQPIGKFDKSTPYTSHVVDLNPGDTVYIFSDGFPDQFGGDKGKKYKYKNFKQFILSISNLPMDEQGDKLNEEFETWKGPLEQIDDVCIIGVRV